MKLPFTDKFLLDLYDLVIQPLGDVFTIFPKNIIEATNPELFKMRNAWRKEGRKRDFRQMIYYLKKKGCIKTSQQGAILITPKGAEKILKVKLKNKMQTRRKDGKWIMIMYDIPEKKRVYRTILHEFLICLGYQKLQESVLICPNEVFQETEAIVKEYNLEKYVKMFLINEKIL